MSSKNNDTNTNDNGDERIEMVGSPCGQHAAYTFYKAFKYLWRGENRIVAVGDFFLVKPWTDQDIISIGELQLAWQDKTTAQAYVSLKLYFLPENTPEGRTEAHGEDEVVSISEKLVMKITDLITWLAVDIQWDKGTRGFRSERCRPPTHDSCIPSSANSSPVGPEANGDIVDVDIPTGCGFNGMIDMKDVLQEKLSLKNKGYDPVTCSVMVLSYPTYCRYRAALKRFENCESQFVGQALVVALGGRSCPGPNTRILYCKDTFDYPELEDHELLCNHLAPKLKKRPRKKRKKRSHSPGSESNESESSVSTVTSSIKSKESPSKNGLPVVLGKRTKGEEVFLQKLHKFMSTRGTPIGRLPSLGFKQLDLFQFYNKVQRAGGYDAAVSKKLWKGIYIELGGHPNNTSAATCTRKHYEKLLLPYEQYLGQPEEGSHDGSPVKKRKLMNQSGQRANSEPPHSPVGKLGHEEKEHSKSVSPCAQTAGEPHVVESSLSPLQESTNTKKEKTTPPEAQPMIVESTLPVQNATNGGTQTPDDVTTPPVEKNSSYLFRPIKEINDDPEIIVLSPKTVPPPPPPPPAPQPKLTIRTDLTTANNNVEEGNATPEKKPNLTLQELMSVGNPISLGGDNHSALSDLARIANQLQGDKQSDSDAALSKEVKLNSGDSVQITLINKAKNEVGLKTSVQAAEKMPRPSVIQKSAADTPVKMEPPPAHCQKPVLPETSQEFLKLFLSDKATASPTSAAHVSSADLSLSLGLNLVRPPTPMASTPSIFAPTSKIYGDPNVDIRRGKGSNHLTSAQIPAAHSSATKTEPRPVSPALRPTPPIVNLSYRGPGFPKPVKPQPEEIRKIPGVSEVNGKCLLDLSINHENLPNSTPSSSTTIKLSPWSSNTSGSMGKSGVLTVAGDVSISVNVKIEGSSSSSSNNSNSEAKSGQNHVAHSAGHSGQSSNRHSVTVLPVVKEEPIRVEREKLRGSSSSSSSCGMAKDRVPVTTSYPRMVDSLMSSASHSSMSTQSSKSAHNSLSFSPAVPISVPFSLTSSTTSSTASSRHGHTATSSIKPPETTLNPVYAPFMDPSLAAYYSMYAPHLYGLPPNPFLPPMHGFPPGLAGPSAAEVTAQVYKDLVQRGYPPALAPGLPVPPLGSLGSIPGMGSIPGLNLGAMSSLYQQLGSKEGSSSDRSSLPKS